MYVRTVIVVGALVGCGGGSDSSKADASPASGDAAGCTPGSQATSTLFLNFNGGTYSHGADDARTNTAGPIDTTRTLAPWPHANAADITACVSEALKPFKITVTDQDPGGELHHEVVLTDVYWDAANRPNLRTISTGNCNGSILSSVSFVFAATSGTDPIINCKDVLLQFATASAGLSFVLDCHDWMGVTPNASCEPFSWSTTPLACTGNGGTTPSDCACGGQYQISMNKMTTKFGASCAP